MRTRIHMGIILMISLLICAQLLSACGDDGDNGTAEPTRTPVTTVTAASTAIEVPAEEDVTLTVGYITDFTGPASTALTALNMAVEDVIGYYNGENLIPGLTVELLSYDGQYDPSRDIPGYEWLMERGADLILSQIPHTVVTLKPRVESDQVLMFAGSAELSSLEPPGTVFSMGTVPDHEALTLLQWIAQYDWDYESKGPAKIGGAGHNESYTTSFLESMERYAQIHPDQFEWVGGRLAPVGTFTWGAEVEALRECDYLFAPGLMTTFVKELRDTGSTAKLIGTDVHLAFLSQIYDAKLWDEINEMLFIRSLRWWNEEGTLIDFTKELLNKNHADKSQAIMRQGTGYLSIHVPYQMMNIIARSTKEAGPQNLDFTALYDAAQSYSMLIDGVERFSFDESKRYAMNYYAVYEARMSGEDLFRISDWIPAVLEP